MQAFDVTATCAAGFHGSAKVQKKTIIKMIERILIIIIIVIMIMVMLFLPVLLLLLWFSYY